VSKRVRFELNVKDLPSRIRALRVVVVALLATIRFITRFIDLVKRTENHFPDGRYESRFSPPVFRTFGHGWFARRLLHRTIQWRTNEEGMVGGE